MLMIITCVSRPTLSGLKTEGHLDVPSEQQGRMSATSATRELDELMACLSDFKVQSNVSAHLCALKITCDTTVIWCMQFPLCEVGGIKHVCMQ